MANDDTDVFEVPEVGDAPKVQKKPQPLYQIFEGSRIAVSRSVGKMWQKKFEAATKAYEEVRKVHEDVFRYYNNNQAKDLTSPRGMFKRGDGTENVIFSNMNVMLPAVYGKDPNITCSTSDEQDQPLCDAMQALLNAIFRRKSAPGINAKPKIKRAAGLGLLTNNGVLKLDYTQKDDSREVALREMTQISTELEKTKDLAGVERLYGRLEALEQNMEVLQASGPQLNVVLPHCLTIDPYAESSDGMDAQWMGEEVYISTASLMARYTKENPEDEGDDETRVLVYKPTHKAKFAEGGSRDNNLGFVLEAAEPSVTEVVSHTDEQRRAYLNLYYTQCYYIWDISLRRVMLFHKDDWTWPLWVWDDPLGLSRFYPYFMINFAFSTGGTISVGETAYYLDQQDNINDINRQMNRIRRSVFDFFFYNSDKVDETEVEQFLKTLRGDGTWNRKILGVRAGEQKISDMIQAFAPPQIEYEQLFNKQTELEAINRLTNTSDALRGVQFKTNTNTTAVNTYQEAMRLSVGAKVDVVEDAVADIAQALAELCIKNMSSEEVAGLIGPALAQGFRNMPVQEFNSQYSVQLVAGSMEKPNSTFKKKEAIELTQAVGQFAKAAPGSTLRIMLKVLQQAFTEIVMKKEDWAAIDQEIQANLSRGVSDGSGGGGEGGDLQQAAQQLPDEVKAQVVQMKQQGASDQEILAFIQEHVNNGTQRQTTGQQQRQPTNGVRQSRA